MTLRIVKLTGAAALATVVTACAGSPQPPFPLPDEPGLYAVSRNNELQRLDGSRKWEVKSWTDRASLSPYADFVVFDPDLARDSRARDGLVDLWRVAWVRSEVDRNGLAGPVQGSEWAVAPLDSFRVPVDVEYARGYPGYIHIVPRSPLQPGLYALRLKKVGIDRSGRLGIDWPEVDKQTYSARNCVDRYINGETSYRGCKNSGDVIASSGAKGLEITLVDPLRQNGALVVQGVVVNTTPDTKKLPAMQAVLLDGTGRRLTQVMIEPRQAKLRAGERISFKTEVPDAPPSTARIDVNFVPMTSAGSQ